MPELPEVETVRRDLERALVGRVVREVSWLDARMVRGRRDAAFIRGHLASQRSVSVGRRGKFLLWRFQSGDRLVLHLGMSGRIRAGVDPVEPWPPHTHLVVRLDDGREVRLSDPRRFGRVEFVPRGRALSVRLGPEPLARAFTAGRLQQALVGRRAPIKALLLDQRVVAGIGNIYADEALFRAMLHPAEPAGALDETEVRRLHRALRRVLRDGLRHRGTTFRSFQDGFGAPGGHAPHLLAYGHEGQACPRCRIPFETVLVAGRTSHYCPNCQRLRAGPGSAGQRGVPAQSRSVVREEGLKTRAAL